MKTICKSCGKLERHYAKGICKECYQKAYRQTEKFKAYQKAYRQSIREQARRYRELVKEGKEVM